MSPTTCRLSPLRSPLEPADRPGLPRSRTCRAIEFGTSVLDAVIVVVLAAILFASPSLAQETVGIDRAAESKNLATWLQDRNLDALLLEHLESQLESTFDAAQREQIAKRLAEIYSDRLLSATNDSQQWLKRTRDLIALYPKFESGRLRVAMLHARYLEQEKQFRNLFREGKLSAAPNELTLGLERLSDDLLTASSALAERSEELFAMSQIQRSDVNFDAELKAIDARRLHCQYLSGWSQYFLAILKTEQRSDLLSQSNFHFREFLRLDQSTALRDYDSRWFDFSSAWHIRAMAGLASVELARENQRSADHLFQLIETNAIDQNSRETVPQFRLLGHAYVAQFRKALAVADQVARSGSLSDRAQVRFYSSVAEVAKFAGNSSAEANVSQELAEQLGLSARIGLARQLAGDLLFGDSDVAEETLPPDESFERYWLDGYREFWRSETKTKIATENQSATEAEASTEAESSRVQAERLLTRAIAIGTATTDPANFELRTEDVARCRYLLAWLELKLGKPQRAVANFQAASQALARRSPVLAAESAWLAAGTLIRISQSDSRRRDEAWSQLDRLVRQFPNSSHVADASFEKLKIELRNMPAADALGRLAEIAPSSQNYANALLEAVRQRYRIWQTDRSQGKPAVESFAELETSKQRLDQCEQSTSRQKFRACLLVLDAMLRQDGIDTDMAAEDPLLEQARVLVANGFEAAKLNIELDFYRFQFAQKRGQTEVAIELAQRIADQGSASRFELPALIALATHADQKLAVTSDPDSIEYGKTIYQRLTEKLGSDSATLEKSANARVALARLGEFQRLSGNSDSSELTFLQLVDLFPGNAQYLRSLALAQRDVGKLDAARAIWQRLALGVDAGSELWFEAKWELAKILAVNDPASAKKLLKQSLQLGGDASEKWKRVLENELTTLESGGGL